MLAISSGLAWKTVKSVKVPLAPAKYATLAQSSYSAEKPPQVERAIRIKSQRRKREELQLKYERFSQNTMQEQPASIKYSRFQKSAIMQRQPSRGREDGVERDSRSSRFPTRDSRSHEKEARSELQLRDAFELTSGSASSHYRVYNTSDRFVSSRGTPRLPLDTKGKENLRQLRNRICTELIDLARSSVRAPTFRREATFAKAESLFEPLSGIERRDSRLYTAMVRLALNAKKRRKAFSLFTEMKKNGVAPDVFAYRALIEGSLTNFPSPSEETEIHQSLQKIFEAMMEDWDLATSESSQPSDNSDRANSKAKEKTGTAKSYSLTKSSALKTFVDHPELFATSCSHYLRCLILRGDMEEAIMLLRRAKDLAATRVGQKLLPQLPFFLSSRFAREVVQEDVEISPHLTSCLPMIFKVVTDSLINQDLRSRMAGQLHWVANEWQDEVAGREKERFDVDVAISYSLRCLIKYDIEEREALASEALQQLYNDEHYALYPVLSSEVSMRCGMQLCGASRPELAMQIFEEGLKYHAGLHESKNRAVYKAQDAPDSRDIISLWTNALDIAIMRCNDLQRGVSILEEAKRLKKEDMRLSPNKLPMGYIMSHFMRKIADQDDWGTAVKVWQLWTDDDAKIRKSNEAFYLRFMTHFLMLAYRTEKKLLELKENGEQGTKRKMERPTRIVMKFFVDDINIKEDEIWTWCQGAMTRTTTTTPSKDGSKSDADNSKLAQKFLGALIVTSKQALESGPQGSDLAAKSDVEAWRATLRQAGRELASGTGKQIFDHDQADWLRSGVGSKTPLALTLDDMRNLLGE